MKPVFTKFGDSRVLFIFSNTFSSFSKSTYGRSSRGAAASPYQNSATHKHYKIKKGAGIGVFGHKEELHAWPSAVNTTSGSPDANMHRFVDNKAAKIMFSHPPVSAATSKPGSPKMDVDAPPSPPQKSKYYSPNKRLGEKGDLEIVVKRDWDVERAERGASYETDRELLMEGKYGRLW